MSVYHQPALMNYIVIATKILTKASNNIYDDAEIKRLRNDARELIQYINNDASITEEMRVMLPRIPEFSNLIEFIHRRLYASPYEDGYFKKD